MLRIDWQLRIISFFSWLCSSRVHLSRTSHHIQVKGKVKNQMCACEIFGVLVSDYKQWILEHRSETHLMAAVCLITMSPSPFPLNPVENSTSLLTVPLQSSVWHRESEIRSHTLFYTTLNIKRFERNTHTRNSQKFDTFLSGVKYSLCN